MAEAKITLLGKDDVKVTIDIEVAKMSKTIDNLLHDLQDMKSDAPLPVPNLTGRVLEKAFKFAEHHLQLEKSGNKDQKTDDWDIEFLKGEKGDWPTLQEILVAANYLDIKVLFDATVNAIITLFIHGKNPEEIKQAFGFVDFTDEQIAELKKQYTWLDEDIPEAK